MIGRREEISVLAGGLESGRPEFVALSGRRSVGKRSLVKEFFNGTFSFYATGVQDAGTRQQLRIFKEALVEYGDELNTIPKDWFDAFSRLKKLSGGLYYADSRSMEQLNRSGLVERAEYLEVPIRVEYALTSRARRLQPILTDLIQWSLTTEPAE